MNTAYNFAACTLCPRKCGADRTKGVGYCGADGNVRICRAALHRWEEPCISGERGSGTVFFSGCPLHCVFCQNAEISRGGVGSEVSVDELARIFLRLQEQGAHNINLVTATHYIPQAAEALSMVKDRLNIPVVYNTGGYERIESLKMLRGLVDIYLPDFKYCDSALSARLSSAPDYREVATEAICEMIEQVGEPHFKGDMLISGVIVRHLVLPGKRADSIRCIEHLYENFGNKNILISLMSQYTPMAGVPEDLYRPVTTFEYSSVCKKVVELGFDGYFQERSSAKETFIPDWNMK